MYFHPLFYKGNVDGLSTIRKRGTSKNKKNRVQDDLNVNVNRVVTTATSPPNAGTVHNASVDGGITGRNSSPRPEVMKIVIQDDLSWSSEVYSTGSRGYFY